MFRTSAYIVIPSEELGPRSDVEVRVFALSKGRSSGVGMYRVLRTWEAQVCVGGGRGGGE